MNKLPVQKIHIPIFILSLIIAAIACNFPDAVKTFVEAAVEECFPVSRSEYERIATQLGQTPQTPKYPESAVYEVCYIDREVASVRMSDGYRSEDNELTEKEEPNSISPSTGANESVSISAGTYIGEFPWKEAAISELIVNEILIEVSSNGLVSGSATKHNSYSVVRHDKCTTYHEFWDSYTINGQIVGVIKEPVEVQKSSYEISDWTNCSGSSGEYHKMEDECSCEGLLTISNGELTITCGTGVECGVYLTARR